MRLADHGHSLKAAKVKRFLRRQRSSLRDRCQPVVGALAGLPDRWCLSRNVTLNELFCCAGRLKHCVMPDSGRVIGAIRRGCVDKQSVAWRWFGRVKSKTGIAMQIHTIFPTGQNAHGGKLTHFFLISPGKISLYL
jgi:hypothetical protein